MSLAQKSPYLSRDVSHIMCVRAQDIRQELEDIAERHFTSYKAVQVVKRCSSCGHGLEKINGCDHVTCAPIRDQCLPILVGVPYLLQLPGDMTAARTKLHQLGNKGNEGIQHNKEHQEMIRQLAVS